MEFIIKKKSNISTGQKNALLDFLEVHPKLVSGKFDASISFINAAKLWEECASVLNAIPGSTKDWKTWRKVGESH